MTKAKLFSLAAAALCVAGTGEAVATEPLYVNDGTVEVTGPPYSDPIDALGFLNNGSFSAFSFDPYQTFNTLNYTNRGTMSGFGGFDFRTHPNPTGATRMADNFVNTGTLNVSGRIVVGATNIMLRSTSTVPQSGLVQLTGHTIDASRAQISMGTTVTGIGGEAPVYWGVGTQTNDLNPSSLEVFAAAPVHDVDYAVGGPGVAQLFLPLANSYVDDVTAESNRTVRVAFVQDFSDGVSNNVYFTEDEIVVEWIWETEDPFTLEIVTNYLFLSDDFGSDTNLAVFPTNTTPSKPVNYTLQSTTSSNSALPAPAPIVSPPGVFTGGSVTNDYSAYALSYVASSTGVSPLGGIHVLPGRLEIEAEDSLDLKLATIALPNYMSLKATNQFEGAQGARIMSVFSDLDLATTNGTLTITNLLLPTIPKLVGNLELYSARWTIEEEDGPTNAFSVLFVNSSFQDGTPTLVDTLRLRSSNSVVISDELNVQSSAYIETQSLTTTTNGAGSFATNGGALNFLDPAIMWSSALPSLQYLTNQGTLSAQNVVSFGSSANPYQTFVNTGTINNQGTLVWSDYFESRGSIIPGSGSVTADFGQGVLADGFFGFFGGVQGDIRLTGDSLTVSNHALHAGRELKLDVTSFLDDGGATNDNQWSAGPWGGVVLPRRPAAGDLLGTTITISIGNSEETDIVWPGTDFGCDPMGFEDNIALKGLVLDGGNQSVFLFEGAAASSALYVETLSLLNYATNLTVWPPGIDIDPSLTVYYAQAFAGTNDVSDVLDGALGGRLCWVSGYAGAFSSVAIEYSESETVIVNSSLAASTSIDSDADGLVNAVDPTPIYTGSQVDLQLSLTATSPARPLLTWATLPGAQNTVLYKDSMAQTEWLTLTNFISTSNSGSCVDTDAAAGSRVYRIQVDP